MYIKCFIIPYTLYRLLCTVHCASRSRKNHSHFNKINRNIVTYTGLSTVWTLALPPFLTVHSHGQKRQTRYTVLSLKYLHAHQMVRTYMHLSIFVCVSVSCCLCFFDFLRLSTVINYIINLLLPTLPSFFFFFLFFLLFTALLPLDQTHVRCDRTVHTHSSTISDSNNYETHNNQYKIKNNYDYKYDFHENGNKNENNIQRKYEIKRNDGIINFSDDNYDSNKTNMPTMYNVKKGYYHDNKVEYKPISVEINDLQTIDMYTGMYSPGIRSNTVKNKPINDPLSSGKFDDIPLLRTNSKEENVDIEKGMFQIIDSEDDVHNNDNNDNESNDKNNNKYNDNEYDINNIDCSIDKKDNMSFDDTNNINNIENSNSNSEKNVVKIVKLQTSVNYSTNSDNGDYGSKNMQPISNLEEIRL